MFSTHDVWNVCVVRDAIKLRRPELWGKVWRLSMTKATPIIEADLGVQLTGLQMDEAFENIMAALGPW